MQTSRNNVHMHPSSGTIRSSETLLIVGAASVLSTLDLFVVNLAFSSIRDSFPGVTNQALSWVLSAYSIMFAALLVPAGRLADRYGRKQVFRLGLAVFAVASAACAFAPSSSLLIVARAVKGIGAAMMVPTSLGLLLAAYPRERHTQMVGIWSATGSVAAALGPVVGGALVHIDWRLIFLINVPLGVVAVWRGKHLVDAPRTATAATPDLLGSALLALGIGALVAAISYAPEWGVASLRFVGTALAAAAFLAWFVQRCRRHPSPALDLRMFEARPFLASTLGMAAFYVGFAMMLLGGTLFLTSVWGWDPLRAGLAFAFGPGTAVISALVAGKVDAPPRMLTMAGASLFVAGGLYWWAMLGSAPSWSAHYLPAAMMFGAGAGVTQTGFIASGMASLPASDYATGTAVLNTARQLGAAIGVAIFVAIAGTAKAPADYAPAWLTIAVFAALGALSSSLLNARGSGAEARSPAAGARRSA